MTIQVAVAGASGYAGGELLRLISGHPMLDLGNVTAFSNAGETLGKIQPHLGEFADRILLETTAENLMGHEVVFLALPHGQSAAIANQLPEHMLVIDCGADFRLHDPSAWRDYYGSEHAGTWPYGLPEMVTADGGKLRGRLREQRRIAVPGCNVTAVTLALAPAATSDLIEVEDLVATLAVGTSGAGRAAKPDLLATEVMGSARAYSVAGSHRHIPEMLQNLAIASGKRGSISFTPILVPMTRGIFASIAAKPGSRFSMEYIREIYQDAYGDEEFVKLLPPGEVPQTGAVLGSNMAHIAIEYDERAGRVLFMCAIDNLVKGTAGAAIQSMNIALGLTEQTGLTTVGVAP